jgi:hypothetical protein
MKDKFILFFLLQEKHNLSHQKGRGVVIRLKTSKKVFNSQLISVSGNN